jgi:protein CpxP
MNYLKKSTLVLNLIILSLLVSHQALARGEGKGGEGKGKFMKFMKELNLSEEQMNKLKEHRKSNKDKPRANKGEMKTFLDEMTKAFINGASDGEIKAINEKMQQARQQMNERRLEKMIFFKNLLTKEQRQKFMDRKKGSKGKGRGKDNW